MNPTVEREVLGEHVTVLVTFGDTTYPMDAAEADALAVALQNASITDPCEVRSCTHVADIGPYCPGHAEDLL